MKYAGLASPTTNITTPWNERIIANLENQKTALNQTPDFILQKRLDLIGQHIEKKFAPLKEFNQRLNQNGEGEWYKKLAIYLVKLPMRSIRNIIQLLYKIISGVLSFGVHPLTDSLELAQLMVKLAHALTLPETYSKIGMGIMGSTLGQAAIIAASPSAYVGLIIGAALSISGISLGVLKTAYQAESNQKTAAVKQYLTRLLPQLPEVFLTAFLISMAITGIRQAVMKDQAVIQAQTDQPLTETQANQFALEYAQKNNIPAPTSVEVTENGNILMRWEGADKVFDLGESCPAIGRYDPAKAWEINTETGHFENIGWSPDPEFAYMDKFEILVPKDDITAALFRTHGYRCCVYEYSEGIPVQPGPMEWQGEFLVNNHNGPLPLTSPNFPETLSLTTATTVDQTLNLETHLAIGTGSSIKV